MLQRVPDVAGFVLALAGVFAAYWAMQRRR